MGSSFQYYEVKTNCINCKKEYYTMHPQFNTFCGTKCEKRYRQRQENGMIPKTESSIYHPFAIVNDESHRITVLRERIKHLKSQLKLNGIKPKRTP